MEKKWYSKGLRFKCTGCGKCCTGAPGYVWVSQEEIAHMAAALDLSIELFMRKYVRRVGQRFSLIERKNGDCIFLKEGTRCEVYTHRPKQCQTFPFWPQTMHSPENWEFLKNECEGIDHPEGIHYTADQIDATLQGGV